MPAPLVPVCSVSLSWSSWPLLLPECPLSVPPCTRLYESPPRRVTHFPKMVQSSRVREYGPAESRTRDGRRLPRIPGFAHREGGGSSPSDRPSPNTDRPPTDQPNKPTRLSLLPPSATVAGSIRAVR